MAKKMQTSAVITLLQLVWDNEGAAMGGRSWERLNGAMSAALAIAVRDGFKFAEDDFATIAELFRFNRWGGNDGDMLGERFYSQACAVRDYSESRGHGENLSAAKSFEAWKQRKPFIYKFRDCLSGRRLAVGAEIHLPNKEHTDFLRDRFKVTSFAVDGLSFIATRTEQVGEDDPANGKYPKTKVAERRRITHEMLAGNNALVVSFLGPKFNRGQWVETDQVRHEERAKVIAVNAKSVRVEFPDRSGPGWWSAGSTFTFKPDQIRLSKDQTTPPKAVRPA